MNMPEQFDGQIKEKIREEVKEPDMYRVLLLNDDYTTTDFVVEILVSIFHKQPIEAAKIMMDVHKKGRGIVGLYTYDIAATKIAQVHAVAREREYPLKCIMERV
jgi:ATP-dependent Clp protease adaptor protein ClpS